MVCTQTSFLMTPLGELLYVTAAHAPSSISDVSSHFPNRFHATLMYYAYKTALLTTYVSLRYSTWRGYINLICTRNFTYHSYEFLFECTSRHHRALSYRPQSHQSFIVLYILLSYCVLEYVTKRSRTSYAETVYIQNISRLHFVDIFQP